MKIKLNKWRRHFQSKNIWQSQNVNAFFRLDKLHEVIILCAMIRFDVIAFSESKSKKETTSHNGSKYFA